MASQHCWEVGVWLIAGDEDDIGGADEEGGEPRLTWSGSTGKARPSFLMVAEFPFCLPLPPSPSPPSSDCCLCQRSLEMSPFLIQNTSRGFYLGPVWFSNGFSSDRNESLQIWDPNMFWCFFLHFPLLLLQNCVPSVTKVQVWRKPKCHNNEFIQTWFSRFGGLAKYLRLQKMNKSNIPREASVEICRKAKAY